MEIALIGNPNVGKTTLFNALTGAKQRVGNWSGVTVERKSGFFQLDDHCIEVVDLPGIYSLTTCDSGFSTDEYVAVEYMLSGKAKCVVNVVDASHLERSMYLSMQLLELGIPLVLAVNMMDMAAQQHIDVDIDALQQQLGCPVIPLQASKKKGIKTLKQAMVKQAINPQQVNINIPYPPALQTAVQELAAVLPNTIPKHLDKTCMAIRLLEEDSHALHYLNQEHIAQVHVTQNSVNNQLAEDVDIIIADSRYSYIHQLLSPCIARHREGGSKLTNIIDKVVMNRILGIPLFFAVMYCMFIFAINIGGAFQDFFDIGGDALLVQGGAQLMQSIHAPDWFTAIVAGGIGLGITTTLTFIPVIGAMFLFLSFLEASGYMARAAFVMDRFMRALGLPGKSFVPMIVGFGCNVPSVMAARTLENPRDRILTIMMSPFMSCGARLAIYAVFVAAFFPTGGQNVIFALYLIGIIMAVLTGLLLRKTLLQGDASPLIMELPPYHLPGVGRLCIATWHRLKAFLLKAGKVIIPLCVLIGFLNALTIDGEINLQEGHERSVLSAVGRSVTPVFAPMGIEQDNWPATVGIATGMVAKEVVVATLNTLYSQAGGLIDEEPEQFSVWQGLTEAVQSIPENLADIKESFTNPIAASAPENELNDGIYGEMYKRFDGQIGAFAYLLFLLLYFPCVSTTAVMARELNKRWTLFSVCWTTGVAYAIAVGFYQLATFTRHPAGSSSWLIGIVLSFAIIICSLKTARVSNDIMQGSNP